MRYWDGVYNTCSCEKTFLWVMHKSLWRVFRLIGQTRSDWYAPHEFLMDTTNMQFKVVPTRCRVVAGGIRTNEA